jgi:hypothetical protein
MAGSTAGRKAERGIKKRRFLFWKNALPIKKVLNLESYSNGITTCLKMVHSAFFFLSYFQTNIEPNIRGP